MLAAQAAAEALQAGDVSAQRLGRYHELVESSWIKEELWKVRNFHQGFERGFVAGMLHTTLQLMSGGRGLRNRYTNVAGHERMVQVG
jgi:electron-transferring-flavoprotein dehydrogenase